ncbi:MAG: zinc/iron-chelating domain-containing protein [Euryarchaeota archaeon]|nr:zinc/iron-chelating domain-containing protein [Euryarchaeota archaeon]|tara:strand:- start:1605 stop:2084 length:480 start_codon:yes stop_codon:yes gene_type:complete
MARWERMFRNRDDSWWKNGVNFTCIPDCGRCCDEPGGIVYLSREDATRIAKNFDMTVKDWLSKNCRTTLDGRFVLESKPEDGRCIYLAPDKTCTIYEVKPSQCSAFPFWRENLVSDRAWQKTKAMCPGIDHPDAIVIDGNAIWVKLEQDRIAEDGFKFI